MGEARPGEAEVVEHAIQRLTGEDARVNAAFDEAVDALTKPVRIRYVDRPEPAD